MSMCDAKRNTQHLCEASRLQEGEFRAPLSPHTVTAHPTPASSPETLQVCCQEGVNLEAIPGQLALNPIALPNNVCVQGAFLRDSLQQKTESSVVSF